MSSIELTTNELIERLPISRSKWYYMSVSEQTDVLNQLGIVVLDLKQDPFDKRKVVYVIDDNQTNGGTN
jgi:hypothetical protein